MQFLIEVVTPLFFFNKVIKFCFPLISWPWKCKMLIDGSVSNNRWHSNPHLMSTNKILSLSILICLIITFAYNLWNSKPYVYVLFIHPKKKKKLIWKPLWTCSLFWLRCCFWSGVVISVLCSFLCYYSAASVLMFARWC